MFAIDGTSDNNNWEKDSRTTIEYNADGTHFTGGSWVTLRLNNNIYWYDGTKDICIEFKLKPNNQMQIRQLSNNSTHDKAITVLQASTTEKSIKLLYNTANLTITPVIDGATQSPVTVTSLTNVGLRLHDWEGDFDCWIKDIRIYPI